jgi:hypothetical protein
MMKMGDGHGGNFGEEGIDLMERRGREQRGRTCLVAVPVPHTLTNLWTPSSFHRTFP